MGVKDWLYDFNLSRHVGLGHALGLLVFLVQIQCSKEVMDRVLNFDSPKMVKTEWHRLEECYGPNVVLRSYRAVWALCVSYYLAVPCPVASSSRTSPRVQAVCPTPFLCRSPLKADLVCLLRRGSCHDALIQPAYSLAY